MENLLTGNPHRPDKRWIACFYYIRLAGVSEHFCFQSVLHQKQGKPSRSNNLWGTVLASVSVNLRLGFTLPPNRAVVFGEAGRV
jgi:hypothetical protein